MVALSNRIVETWTRGRTLSYIHYPLAEGALPPSTDARYYQPLRGVVLPSGTRFVAGFVHESLSFAEHAHILSAIEDARGEQVDVASACGLERRTPADATQALELTRQLVAL